MTKKRAKRKQQTARIYYGPEGHETSMYWRVTVTDARKPVTINGSAAAALRAHRGVTIGCALSMTGVENAKHFDHPVYLMSFTRSTALAVDRLNKEGHPCHAVRYGHSYAAIVNSNDDGTLKKMIQEHPEIMERPFHLRPPRKRHVPGSHVTQGLYEHRVSHRSVVRQRGALARAVKAGRIGKHVAQQLRHVAETKEQAATNEAT